MTIDTPGLYIIEQDAPIATPPDIVALRILYIYNPLPIERALITYVPITFPVKERAVFITIWFC